MNSTKRQRHNEQRHRATSRPGNNSAGEAKEGRSLPRIILTLAVSALTLAIGSAPAAAADYFVKPAGSDANNGLSVAQAFHTIQKSAGVAGPGDTVHLQAGTYDEVVRLERSGSAGNPITFTADGNPVVMDAHSEKCPPGKNTSSGAPREALLGYNVHDVVLDGIEITRYCYNGVIFTPGSHDITIRNLNVHHNGLNIRKPKEGNGIAVQDVANVLIESNRVNDNVPRNTYSGSAIAVDGSDQVVVRNNIADRNNGNGILIEDGTNVLVEGNRARFNIGDLGSWGTAGIWIDGGHTVTVRGNWFEGNLWAGIFATDETPSDPYGYEIYNNVSIGNGSGIWLDGIGQAGKPLDLVYNNTFVDNTVVGVKLVNRGVSQVTHTRVYDNIVAQMNTDRPALAVNAGTYPDVVLDRNLYFRQGSTKPISWWFEPGRSFDTTPSSVADRAFAEYQALSGWDASGLAANPLFVGPGAEDYHLLAASPAIDAGSSLFPAPSDYDGHARPLGAGPDIGALEGSGPCAAGACIAGTPPSSAYDSALRPINPVSITIPQGATSVTKLLNVAVRNGDVSPRDLLGHRIQLLADDGDCPAGTVTGIPAFRYMGGAFRSPESSNFIKGGRTLPAQVKLTIDRAAFASVSDCTLQLTVKTPVPGNVDPVPGNDSVGVELNVSAH